jgi:monothiol glutaredoxin
MDAQLKAEIEGLVQTHPVLLFMKGTKSFPQCGFSATVINILKEVGVRDLKDVNILARADLREGLKEYTNWPTFPQLYVKGQFVGGCDIVKELYASGELYDVLGVVKPELKLPSVSITPAAKQAVLSAAEGEARAPNQGAFALRIEISPQYEYALSIDEPGAGDLQVQAEGLTLLFDRQSAQRADGLVIDFLAADGGGFKITNPNEPPRVKQVGPRELKQLLDAGAPIELFDVRTAEERNIVKLEQAQPFDKAAQDKLAALDRNTPIYFHCHHGGRSQQAAEHYLRQGFKQVFNLAGGIDAYALEIDPELARY